MTATEMIQRIRNKELSVTEVMIAHLTQIERINPQVNAIVSLLPEQAIEQAQTVDKALARGDATGALYGLPIAHKDLVLTKNMRTTFGSPIYKDFVPDQDGLIVERLKKGGRPIRPSLGLALKRIMKYLAKP
jgi:amidase